MTGNRTEITLQAPAAIGKTTHPSRLVRIVIAGADIATPRVEIPIDNCPSEILTPFQDNRKGRRARKAIARCRRLTKRTDP